MALGFFSFLKNLCSDSENSDNAPLFEENLKSAVKSKNGLYPHEILVLSYASSCLVGEKLPQSFWLYRYGISDTLKILDSLEKRLFIKESPYMSSLKNLKSADLKDILKRNNLKMAGNKASLIKRITENIDTENLNNMFENKFYELTDLGNTELEENAGIIYVHKNDIGIDIWEMAKLQASYPTKNFSEIILNYLNNNCSSPNRIENIPKLRTFLMQQKEYTLAFPVLLEEYYYGLNGLYFGYSSKKEFLKDNWKLFFPYPNALEEVSILLTYLHEIMNSDKKYFEYLRSTFINITKKSSLPFQLFTTNESLNILISYVNDDEEMLKTIFSEAQARNKIN